MSILSKLKSKKCGLCKIKISKKEKTTDIKMNTSEGIVTLEICKKCGDFWENSAGILQKIRNKNG